MTKSSKTAVTLVVIVLVFGVVIVGSIFSLQSQQDPQDSSVLQEAYVSEGGDSILLNNEAGYHKKVLSTKDWEVWAPNYWSVIREEGSVKDESFGPGIATYHFTNAFLSPDKQYIGFVLANDTETQFLFGVFAIQSSAYDSIHTEKFLGEFLTAPSIWTEKPIIKGAWSDTGKHIAVATQDTVFIENNTTGEELVVNRRGDLGGDRILDIWWTAREELHIAANANSSNKVPGKREWVISVESKTEFERIVILENGIKNDFSPSAESFGRNFGCEQSSLAFECYNFIENFLNNKEVIPFSVVYSGDIADYVKENYFTAAESIEVQRGIFMSGLDDEILIISLVAPLVDERKSNILIFRVEDDLGKVKKANPVFLHSFGRGEMFVNKPEYLVQRSVPFFVITNNSLDQQACTPVRWAKGLYRIRFQELEEVWETTYYSDGLSDQSTLVENLISRLKFIDTDGNGNKEVVQEGTLSFCKGDVGICYSKNCTEVVNTNEVRKIFEWDSQLQTFIEQG